MNNQIEAVIEMIGESAEWLAEINSSPNHKIQFPDETESTVFNSAVADGEERMHAHAATDLIHGFPRCIVATATWEYDGHKGNCKVDSSLMVAFELIRPTNGFEIQTAADFEALTPAQLKFLKTQYIDVSDKLADIMIAFSDASFGGGAKYADAVVTLVQGPWVSPSAEVPIVDVNDNPLVHWWADFRVEAKTT